MIYHYNPFYAEHAIVYRTARNKKGLTQDAASAALGISKRYLQYIETGQRVPRIDLVSKMSDLYACDFSSFKMNFELGKEPDAASGRELEPV